MTMYFDDDTSRSRSIIEKTGSKITSLNKMFGSVYIPSKNICIDESTIAFKGNCRVKVYNHSKPSKWGLQMKCLCDSKSHYVYSIKLYDGDKKA